MLFRFVRATGDNFLLEFGLVFLCFIMLYCARRKRSRVGTAIWTVLSVVVPIHFLWAYYLLTDHMSAVASAIIDLSFVAYVLAVTRPYDYFQKKAETAKESPADSAQTPLD